MKKLVLTKETICRLNPSSIGFVQGAMPVDTYTCANCATDACATTDCTYTCTSAPCPALNTTRPTHK